MCIGCVETGAAVATGGLALLPWVVLKFHKLKKKFSVNSTKRFGLRRLKV